MINLMEFNKAEEMLKERGINYERKDNAAMYLTVLFEKHQILGNGWDFVCSTGSYGSDDGLLEYWSNNLEDSGDDPIGWLTAEEVLEKIEAGI